MWEGAQFPDGDWTHAPCTGSAVLTTGPAGKSRLLLQFFILMFGILLLFEFWVFGVFFFFFCFFGVLFVCLFVFNRNKSFPGGASGKESACQCRWHKRHGFNPRVGKIPWRRTWLPSPVFLPGEASYALRTGRLQPVGLKRVRHDWVTHTTTATKVDLQCCVRMFGTLDAKSIYFIVLSTSLYTLSVFPV